MTRLWKVTSRPARAPKPVIRSMRPIWTKSRQLLRLTRPPKPTTAGNTGSRWRFSTRFCATRPVTSRACTPASICPTLNWVAANRPCWPLAKLPSRAWTRSDWRSNSTFPRAEPAWPKTPARMTAGSKSWRFSHPRPLPAAPAWKSARIPGVRAPSRSTSGFHCNAPNTSSSAW